MSEQEQEEKLRKLFERGIITEQQYYQKRREIYGLSPATPSIKTPTRFKWWHYLLAFLALGYIVGQFKQLNNPIELNQSEINPFNNPEALLVALSSVGVGEFYRYNCNNIGECEAYHGAKTWETHPYGHINMAIDGTQSKVDSIKIVLEVDKGADLQRALDSYNQVLIKTMAKLGVPTFNPSPISIYGLKYKTEGLYIITGEIDSFSSRSVTVKRIPQ